MSRGDTREAGSGIIEAIVALAIIAIGLSAFCKAAGDAYRAAARIKIHGNALALTRSHLDRLGQDGPLQDGVVSGHFSKDMPWHLTVSALSPGAGAPNAASRSYWLVLETFDRRGVSLVRLETAKLVWEAP